jgi:hypothetical protein
MGILIFWIYLIGKSLCSFPQQLSANKGDGKKLTAFGKKNDHL